MSRRAVKFVSFGGGGGHSVVIEAVTSIPGAEERAVCTGSDQGKDTGQSVLEYAKYGINGSLGDVSKCICALSSDRALAEELMFRFSSGRRNGTSVKNTLLLALIMQYGQEKGLRRMHEICRVPPQHKVIPATVKRTILKVGLVDGTVLSGEDYLDTMGGHKLFNPKVHGVKKVWLQPSVPASEEAIAAVGEADFIIISCGDLWTSVIPSLLPLGIAQAIASARGRLVIMINLMTKIGETDGYQALDFVRAIQKYVGGRKPDVVLCNRNGIPQHLLKKYHRKEYKVKVVPDILSDPEYSQVKLIRSDLWMEESGHIVHDPAKVAQALRRIIKYYRGPKGHP